eukprot:gene2551-527_t
MSSLGSPVGEAFEPPPYDADMYAKQAISSKTSRAWAARAASALKLAKGPLPGVLAHLAERAAMDLCHGRLSVEAMPCKPITPPKRWFAFGDAQGRASSYFAVLDREGLLGVDGFPRPDVGLVSLGDHFDFVTDPAGRAVAEGGWILRWLAAHDRTQVVILLGNHDMVRVQEYTGVRDDQFRKAQVEALRIPDKKDTEHTGAVAAFLQQYPWACTPGYVARDYSSYASSQGRILRHLLLEGRVQLAAAVCVGKSEVLATHAGVTHRELQILKLGPAAGPARIAGRLNAWLAQAVDVVRRSWSGGGVARPLNLAPVHVAGKAGVEGGGLLHHRPSLLPLDSWAADPERPRRFDPLTALPVGLAQLAGHTGHARLARGDLASAATTEAKSWAQGGIRTLQIKSDGTAQYDMGILPHLGGAATFYLGDTELAHASLEHCELVPLTSVTPLYH